jgi:hypothetical protein
MIFKRLAATAALAGVLGTAACSRTGGGDYQGGSEGETGETKGMNGGAATGSGAGPADAAGAPSTAAAPAPADSSAAAPSAGTAGVQVPVQAAPSGPSNVSTPSGNGTPPQRP